MKKSKKKKHRIREIEKRISNLEKALQDLKPSSSETVEDAIDHLAERLEEVLTIACK